MRRADCSDVGGMLAAQLFVDTSWFWLNWFNAELSPKRYWGWGWVGGGGRGGDRDPRQVKMELFVTLHCQRQNDCALRWAVVRALKKCFVNCEGQSNKTMSTNHDF